MDKVKVLLIDDEDDARRTLAEYLELQAEFEVVDFARGQSALADLQKNRGDYTAVILDWVLSPDMPGDDVLAQIQTSFPQLPVMVVTGKAPADGLKAMAEGAYQFLQRPINHTELINAIRNVAHQDLIFWEMAREVSQFLTSDACLAWKLHRKERHLRIVAWAGDVDESSLRNLRLDLADMMLKQCFHNKEPLCFQDIHDAEEFDPDYQQEAIRQGWTSLICTPLFYQGQLIGLLDSFTHEAHSCGTDIQQNTIKVFLQAYAHQSAAAVRNADLTEQLHALNEINKLLTSTYEEKAIIQQILATGLELVGNDIGWIYSVNHQENQLVLEAWKGPTEVQIKQNRKLGGKEEGITGHVARKGEVLNIHNVVQDKRHKKIDGLDIKSELAVPLRRGAKIIGVMTVKSPFSHAFTSDDEDILTALSAQAAVAIERTRFTNHLQQVSQLALTEDVHELLTYVVNAVQDLTGADAAFWMISKKEKEGDKFLRIAAHTSGISKTYARKARLSTEHGQSIHVLAWEQKRPYVKNDIFDNQEPVFQNTTDAQKYGWRSFMVVPLLGQTAERLGTLSLYGKSLGQFKQLEIDSVQAFANQVAITLQQQKRTSALQQLAQISQTVTEWMTDHPKQLLEKVAQLAYNLTKANCVVIYPYDPEKRQFYDIDNIAAVGLNDHLSFITNKPRRTGFASFIREKKAVVVHDVDVGNIEIGLNPTEPTYLEDVTTVQKILADAQFIKREKIKAFVGIPLRAREKEKEGEESLEVGILYINYRAPHHFSTEELQIIDIYAHHVANVVWSARLYTAEQRQARELVAVQETALKILAQEENLNTLLKVLVRAAIKLLGGKGGKVYIRVPGRDQVQLLAAENVDHNIQPLGYTINYGEGLAGRVIQTKKPMIVTEYANWEHRLEDLTHLFGAVIEVPLLRGEEAIGVLTVFDDAEKRRFTEDDFPILERLAQQASLAIYNVNMVKQEKTLREQAETLREVSSIISANLDLKEVTSRILDELRKVIAYNKTTIQLIRGDSRELIAYRGFTEKEIDPRLLRPVSQDSLVERIVKSKEPMILSNLQYDAPEEWEIRKETEDVMSWVGLPLVYGNQTIGFMTLDCQQPGFYTQKDKDLLILFSNQAAVAIQNARLYEAAQYRIQDLEIVSKVVQEIGPKLEIDDLLKTIVSQIADQLNCTHCTIFFPEYKNNQVLLIPKATYGEGSEKIMNRYFERGEGVAGWVYVNGESLMLNNATEDPRFASSRQKGLQPRSLIVVPIKSEGKTIGVLSADQDELNWFDERGKQLVETLANHAAVAIQNARFVQQERAISDVASAISANLQIGDVTERILDALYKVVQFHNAGIQLLQGGQREQIAFRSYVGKKADLSIMRIVSEDPLIQSIVKSQETLILSNTLNDRRFGHDGTEDVASWACLPLVYGSTTIGTMTLDHQQPGFFTDKTSNLLGLFADQAAIALQNTLLFEEVQRYQDAQIQAVSMIARSIASSTNIELMLKGILEAVKSLIPGTELAEVYRVDHNVRELIQISADGSTIDQELQIFPVGEGIIGWVAKHNEPQIVLDVYRDKRYRQILSSTSSKMVVPLQRDNELIGVLNLEHPQIGAFRDKDLQLAKAIAALIVVAMQIDNQFGELEERARRLMHLQVTTTTILAKPTDKEKLLLLIVDNLSEIFRNAPCIIRLYDSKKEIFTGAVVTTRTPKDVADEFAMYKSRPNGTGYHVVGTKEPYYIFGIQEQDIHNLPSIRKEYKQMGVEAMAILPMISEGNIAGTLYLCLQEPYQFTPNDKQILKLFANQAAVAVKNARLYEQIQAHREAEINALEEIGRSIAIDAPLDRKEVLNNLVRLMEPLSLKDEPGLFVVRLLDTETNELVAETYEGDIAVDWQERIPVGKGITGWVAQHKKALRIDDVSKDNRYLPGLKGSRSELAVPMLKGGEVIGVLNLEHPQNNAFSENDVKLAEAIARLAVVAVDNTRRTQAWRDLRERAEAAEKLAAIGKIGAEFVHRMKNLGGTIPVHVNIAKENLDPKDIQQAKVIKELDELAIEAHQLLQAAEDIALSTEKRTLEEVFMPNLIEAGLKQVKFAYSNFDKQFSVKTSFDDALPTVFVDRNGLQDTLANIIKNGLDAMPNGGTLTMKCKKTIDQSKPFLQIAITDTGIGIPAQNLSRVFDLFFSTKKEGWGFGLWRDKVYLNGMGGDIEVESIEGKGSTFVINIPIE